MGISAALGSQALLPAGLGFRNLLINGDFGIWQRGTSGAMATGSYTGFLADRWTAARASYAAGGTVSRQLASLEGFQYCSRVQRNSGNTDTARTWYFQTMETANSIPVAGKTVTYSFYIRAGANFSGSLKALLYSGTATDGANFPDGAITGSVTVIESTLSLTTSWQRVVLSGRVGSSATQLFAGFEWNPSGTAGAADFFEITGVQLEANTQPTPFEQLPIGVELALCQRYFQTIGPDRMWAYNRYWNVGLSGGDQTIQFEWKTTMRTAPTVTTTAGSRIHSFRYASYNTGEVTYNLEEIGTSADNCGSMAYYSTNNSGNFLAVGYTSGRNVNTMWVNAEL
jgi:hypothetical protein